MFNKRFFKVFSFGPCGGMTYLRMSHFFPSSARSRIDFVMIRWCWLGVSKHLMYLKQVGNSATTILAIKFIRKGFTRLS